MVAVSIGFCAWLEPCTRAAAAMATILLVAAVLWYFALVAVSMRAGDPSWRKVALWGAVPLTFIVPMLATTNYSDTWLDSELLFDGATMFLGWVWGLTFACVVDRRVHRLRKRSAVPPQTRWPERVTTVAILIALFSPLAALPVWSWLYELNGGNLVPTEDTRLVPASR